MYESWELCAKCAHEISDNWASRNLELNKKYIMEKIKDEADAGNYHTTINFNYYEVSSLEEWSNIYNWLLSLHYTIEDYSGSKFNPCFVIHW